MSARDAAIDAFLATAGWAAARRVTLAGDASLRRYWRLDRAGECAVLMDAPPPHEDVRPFARIAHLLARHDVSAPGVLAQDAANGFLLLEDFGDRLFGRTLADQPALATDLYALATESLIALQRRFTPPPDLPRFDDARAIAEASRLLEWLWPGLFGASCPDAVAADYRAAWSAVLPAWRGVPDGFVHFDFFVDNLVHLPLRDGPRACGWLDFQDGVLGPCSFDLMSLLQDVRRDVPADLERAMIDRYRKAFPALDRAAFTASYAVGGAQRNARILGTFVRLWQRDGKPGYLKFLPRVWALLERDLAHAELAPLRAWFDKHLPPALRASRLPGAPA